MNHRSKGRTINQLSGKGSRECWGRPENGERDPQEVQGRDIQLEETVSEEIEEKCPFLELQKKYQQTALYSSLS